MISRSRTSSRGFTSVCVVASFALCLLVGGLLALGVYRGVVGVGAPVHVGGQAGAPLPARSGLGMILLRTLAVPLLIGLLATALGFPAAWAMRRLSAAWSAVLVAPMLLPSYLAYAAWGLLRAPGTWLGDMLERGHDASWFVLAGWVQAIAGLSLWASPIAALILGVSIRRIDPESLDALRLAGGGPIARARIVLGMTRAGVVGAVGVVALMMLGSAVPLHLADIQTWAIVIWRDLADSAGAAQVWRRALPLILIGVIAGWVLASRLVGVAGRGEAVGVERDAQSSRRWIALAAAVWVLAVIVPLVLLWLRLKQASSIGRFVHDSNAALLNSIQVGLGVAALGGLVTMGTAIGLGGPERSWPRRLAVFSLRLWLAMGLIPGVLIGSALIAASADDATTFLADTNAGMIAAHLARFGAVAALAGWWLSRSEPASLRDARLLVSSSSGWSGLRGWWWGVGQPGAGVILAACAAMFALSIHEIEASVVVSPPGPGNLAERMLSLLHYLREEELTAGALVVFGVGTALCILAGLGWSWSSERLRRTGALLLFVACIVALAGCRRVGTDADGAAQPRLRLTIGEPGRSPGQFVIPRAIDTDGKDLIVIDKSGRCQVIAPSGEALAWWVMPAIDRGKPTGVTVGPDGLIYVADSHEHRVAVYPVPRKGAREDAMVSQWGEYGTGPGQFTFPSDVMLLPAALVKDVHPAGGPLSPGAGSHGLVYVSEYGGNDRVSVFDAESHAFLFAFGREGSSETPGQVEFRRPQSMLLRSPPGGGPAQIVISDACNNRIGVFTLGGGLVRWIGRPNGESGQGVGEFFNPYGLCLLPDNSVLVVEMGNARLQRVDVDRGVGLNVYCTPGRLPGQLGQPWGVCVLGGVVYVADAANDRVTALDLEDIMSAPVRSSVTASAAGRSR